MNIKEIYLQNKKSRNVLCSLLETKGLKFEEAKKLSTDIQKMDEQKGLEALETLLAEKEKEEK